MAADAGTEQRHDLHSPTPQPLNTIKRHLIVVPEKAEQEAGFQMWQRRIRRLAENSGPESSSTPRRPRWNTPQSRKTPGQSTSCPFRAMGRPAVARTRHPRDDCLWVVMSRRDRVSPTTPAVSRPTWNISSPDTAPYCSIPCRRATPKAAISDGSEVQNTRKGADLRYLCK